MYGKLSLFSRVVTFRNVRSYSKDSKKLLEFLANMPKPNSSRIAEAQRQRQQITRKSEKYGPSTVYLQVLGSGARGAPNTLYLFTDQKKYLFNCGEGTQRLAHEHKVKLSRLDHIFITNKTWRNIGGLPGLSLTLQDVGVPNITLHGPEGLDELYNATRRFVIMKDMNVTMAKCSTSEDFEDNVMTVKYVHMGPQGSILQTDPKPAAKKPKLDDKTPIEFEEFIHDDTDYYKPETRQLEGSNRNKHLKSKPKPTADKDPLKKKTERVLHDLEKQGYCTVAYICTLKKRLGTLDLEKCVELGVKPGPMLGQLKSGHDVVLPDGKIVLSKDVKTPDDPGPVFIVLEVPDLLYLRESEFSAHFDDGSNPPENIPTVVVHYTPSNVIRDPAYRAFMSKFGPSTHHLVLNSQNSCLGSEAVHRTQHKLHLLDADMFPLLRDVSVPALWTASPLPRTDTPERLKGLEELKNKIATAQFQNLISMEESCGGDAGIPATDSFVKLELIAARTLTMFHLRPKKQLDRSAEPKLHIQEYIQETMDVDGFVASLEQFRRLVESMRYSSSDSQEYPKVVFLGTGSCIPSKTRNTSAIVLHVEEARSMLLDCGEGTFGQLVRFYGPKRVNGFLRTLKAVYVSHLHADHHIGLIGVLQARRQAFEEVDFKVPPEPLYLLAPGQIVTWLSVYDQQFEPIRDEFTLIPNQNLLESRLSEVTNADMTSAVLACIGVEGIRTCQVAHCPNAFGVAIDVDQQYKVTYSGDTIPCEELVTIGKNSTLLIHEATMEDELAEEARTKMHSTTSQAIDIGRRMDAKYTILTHFSQRYARLPRLNAHILNDNNSVGIAFDNMQITMTDLDLLPHMYAPLQLMFAEHCVELELKALNRARQKERRPPSPNLPSSAPRKRSPSCHGAVSMPGQSTSTRYKDSNSSRLRQQRTSSSAEGRSSCRSKSCSATKATHCPAHSTTKLRNGGSAPHSPDRSLDVKTPRTTSESSNLGNVHEKVHASVTKTSFVVDTRSKTISSANTKCLPDVAAVFSNKNSSSISKKAVPSMAPETANSYGKPLVTPIHKKLSLRREDRSKTASVVGSEKHSSPTKRSRSPVKSSKAEHRRSPDANSSNGSNLGRPKLPTKTVSRSRENGRDLLASSDPKLGARSLNMKSVPATKSLKQQLPMQRSSLSPRRQSLDRKPQEAPPTRQCSRSRMSTEQNHDSTKENVRPHAVVKPTSTSLGNTNVKVKKSGICRDIQTPPPINGKNFVNHSNKSFMPQLEDIKSSFLLLNNKIIDRNTKARQGKVKSGLGLQSEFGGITDYWLDFKVKQIIKAKGPQSIFHRRHSGSPSKPPPLNEKYRKEKLMEAINKYKTKKFWNDSKFEKIEGLNWISWR